MIHTCKCKECGNFGMILKGWYCVKCKIFNDEEKTELTNCRVCETAKPLSFKQKSSKAAKKGWETRRNNEIRQLYATGKFTIKQLAEEYNKAPSTIGAIVKGMNIRKRGRISKKEKEKLGTAILDYNENVIGIAHLEKLTELPID